MSATSPLHPSAERLADYFGHGLSEEEEIAVEEHLAECDACTDAARLTFAASGLLDHWTAPTHREAALRSVLAGALVAAGQQPSAAGWRVRLAAWVERWAGRAEAAVRVVIDAPGQAARAIAESVPEIARPDAAWQLAPAPAAVPTRGRAGAQGAARPIIVCAGGDGAPRVQIAVSGQRGEVVVRLDDLPPGAEPPLVLLVPTGQWGAPRLAAPEPGPAADGDTWIARFEGLGPGEYLVALEPLA